MKYVSATEIKNNLANTLDIARREPITIQRNGRPIIVMMAIEDYNQLSKSITSSFKSFCDHVSDVAISKGLDQQTLEQLLNDN
jgi:prevent-host-death family protein